MSIHDSASIEESSINDPESMQEPIGKIYVERSCLMIHVRSSLRKKCIAIITSQPFDNFITFLIVANCVFLAIDGPTDPYDPNNLTTKQTAIYWAEYIFLGLFTMEMILKIIGFGFCFGPNTYMKNSWNWLDFSVVIIGYLGFVGVNNLSSLRTFRVLRPLRTLTTVPGMKVIVVSMISALPALSGVVLLTLGMFFVWSVIGLQLWGGILDSRCYFPPTRQYQIPLVRCTTSSVTTTSIGASCSGVAAPPSAWDCAPVLTSDVYTIGGSTLSFAEISQSHTFLLNRTSGNATVEGASNECRITCAGTTKCGLEGTTWNVPGTSEQVSVEIMLSLNQSDWTTTGELIHNRDQWPVPRNLIDRPLDEKKRHGINVAATIAKLRLDRVSGCCGGVVVMVVVVMIMFAVLLQIIQ